MFAPVAPILQAADLAICHMEIPIGGPTDGPGVYGRSAYGGNLVLAPFEGASGMKAAGFDRCTTSSNHSNDLVRVARLGYTRTLNTTATDPWWLNYAHSVGQVVTDVAAARHLGAEVVIVSLHLGTELLSAPTPDDRAFVTDLTVATHIDLVIEHGPHVIQPLEQVNGTWVYWSVGNFVSGMGWAQSGRYADMRTLDGLIATARFVEISSGQFTVTPIPVLICDEHTSRTVYPVITTLADPTISVVLRDQLQQCLARSVDVVATLR